MTNLLASSDTADSTQAEVDAEMASVAATAVEGEPQPRLDYPPYRSSLLRHPTKALHPPTRKQSSCGARSSASATSARSRPTSPCSTPANRSANG